ncbi:hypothetical protein GCM10017557_53720 [Streptomyces aurantiacus]|uniref:Uncharacterized protein n=1 Tax=Streptomyces aurantiacus TaxID=47760 RepID=A0A7G1P3Z9_9ACTN|nr:hypothetical protein GCM10017557_53720 [Streptomyces aurantiacus]
MSERCGYRGLARKGDVTALEALPTAASMPCHGKQGIDTRPRIDIGGVDICARGKSRTGVKLWMARRDRHASSGVRRPFSGLSERGTS